MRKGDTFDVMCSISALLADVVSVYAGVMLAVWVRFDSGWISMRYDLPASRYIYYIGAGFAALLFVLIFQMLDLYKRPQTGAFSEKIPRIIRACGLGVLLAFVLASAIRTEPPFSRVVAGLSFFTISSIVLIVRFALSRIERHYAKYQTHKNNIIILGVNITAANLKAAIEREPRLRSRVLGFLRVNKDPSHKDIAEDMIMGEVEELSRLLDENNVDQVILTASELERSRMVEIILLCERTVVQFRMVPDMLRLLTTKVDIQTINGIPLLGTGKWPLDCFWNRATKRIEDISGALIGLFLSLPVLAIAAIFIKRSSPGPVFFKQVRCGQHGNHFTLYKLRTMRTDAETDGTPGWTTEDDPRRTRTGALLRRWNIDELPQFWNVLKGEMSIVGPRPERPHFVEKFKEDISRYMWRHVSKPGLTGWAQVNGLRGDTSIPDRISHDLYYLENWSLALDFKIISKTFFVRGDDY